MSLVLPSREIITRPAHDVLFHQAVLDLFLRRRSSHMSPHLYNDHTGVANGESISGAYSWSRAAQDEFWYYVIRSDTAFLRKIILEIAKIVPHGLPFVDLGPGSLKAVQEKSLLLVQMLENSHAQPLDSSAKFVRDYEGFMAEHAPSVICKGKVLNFKSPKARHDFGSKEVAGYYGGSTNTNLVHPFDIELGLTKLPSSSQFSSIKFPDHVLTQDIKKLGKLMNNSWMITSFDGNQDEGSLYKAYRSRYFDRFIRNVFYRAATELSASQIGPKGFSANYDPNGFDYEPVWIPSAHLLANYVVANKDQEFSIGRHSVEIERDDAFLVLNSFKFPQEVYKRNCKNAGARVEALWSDDESPTNLCITRTPANENVLRLNAA